MPKELLGSPHTHTHKMYQMREEKRQKESKWVSEAVG